MPYLKNICLRWNKSWRIIYRWKRQVCCDTNLPVFIRIVNLKDLLGRIVPLFRTRSLRSSHNQLPYPDRFFTSLNTIIIQVYTIIIGNEFVQYPLPMKTTLYTSIACSPGIRGMKSNNAIPWRMRLSGW
jgi:hypothetical protein